jgi:protein-tyrosine phosphatase
LFNYETYDIISFVVYEISNIEKVRPVKFIDIHNHLIYGIDDGANSRQEMLEMLKMAISDGIEKIMFTPHFKEKAFENDKSIIDAKKEEMEQLIQEHQLDIEVFFGSEIFVSNHTSHYLNEGRLKTLNDTPYILVETHRANIYHRFEFGDMLYNFQVDGFKPIIAHPERYEFIYENPNKAIDLVKDGNLIQINATSLLDKKKPSFKLAKKLLDKGLVHFVASDSHDTVYRPPVLSEAYAFVKKNYGVEVANQLFYENPLKVLKNEKIETEVKTKKWLKIF